MITDFYGIQNIEKQHGVILRNILLNNIATCIPQGHLKKPKSKFF